ncbi:MAG TPA: diaminopimelate aminotransferase, partial [candidate division Zixibacteria bacterium]|nr:diaminopimelate aminotransferase [candidate division Zixibacteria bacterium]
MADDFTKIEQQVDKYRNEVIDLEKLMTSIPALGPENGGDGEMKKAIALKAYLKKAGFPDPQEFNAPDDRVTDKVRPNLVYLIEGQDKSKTVWVMAHTDIVPPGDLAKWEGDPYTMRIVGDRLYGRGVEDNQHGLVAGVFAAKAFLDTKTKPKFNIGLLFVADEEVGSNFGIGYVLEKHNDIFKKTDLILVPDSGDPSGTPIEIAEKSICWLKVETTGRQCHASRPDQGINAFAAASKLAAKVHALYNIFDYKDTLFEPATSTFEPTKKEANVPNVNTIPGDDVFYIDCRVLPKYKLDEVEAMIRKWADEIEGSENVKIRISPLQRAEAAPPTAPDAPVVEA